MRILKRSNNRGFTLPELVLVIVILGILTATAAPRFFARQPFEERGFSDDVISALRYAQKLAVATGCDVQVTIGGGQYELNQRATNCTTGAFTRDVLNPGTTEAEYKGQAPGGVTFTSTVSPVVFDVLGRASANATVTVGGRTLLVVADTGLVYEP